MAWQQLAPNKHVWRTPNDFLVLVVLYNGQWRVSRPIPLEVGQDIDLREFLDGVSRQDLLAYAKHVLLWRSFETLAEAQAFVELAAGALDTEGLSLHWRWRDYAPRINTYIQTRTGIVV